MSEVLRNKTIAILGYGNQGRAQALCLRDAGHSVIVGARRGGNAWTTAEVDGFYPMPFATAAAKAEVLMFLLPDQAIGPMFRDLIPVLEKGPKWIGFAHGFAFHFGHVPRLSMCEYFLVAPKGAGSVLRERYVAGKGLPTAFAVALGSSATTREIAQSYARVVAGKSPYVRETTFQLETEGDLFGEQVVLVGGVWELMRSAFETLVKNGHPPEAAFFDVCQELQATLDLFLKNGPAGMANRISPTALYGAATRGPRVINQEARDQMQTIFEEIRSGRFAEELMDELRRGGEKLERAKHDLATSQWQQTFESLKDIL